MQITKGFSGTLADVGSTSSRRYSFGYASTVTTYLNRVDFINQVIADFLHNDCGVDAAYEARYGEENKFLWINGVPFLYYTNSSQERWYVAPPFGGSTSSTSSYVALFRSYNSGVYSFSLMFTGNPNGAFSLRFKPYDSTSVTSSSMARYIKAKNLLTNRDSLVWVFDSGTANLGNCNGIDRKSDGSPDADSFSTASITYLPSISAKPVNKTSGEGRFPLVPLLFGIWRPLDVYCHIRGFDLPAAMAANVENQTEIEISGRRFINTTSESLGSGYINIGLIEVTD